MIDQDVYEKKDRYDADEPLIMAGDRTLLRKRVFYWAVDGAGILMHIMITLVVISIAGSVLWVAGKIVIAITGIVVGTVGLMIVVGYVWNEVVPNIDNWIE